MRIADLADVNGVRQSMFYTDASGRATPLRHSRRPCRRAVEPVAISGTRMASPRALRPAGYPTERFVSDQIYRLLSGWFLPPPLVRRAVRAHGVQGDASLTPDDPEKS
jgi:hypothetical protein